MIKVLVVEDEIVERKFIINLLENYQKTKIVVVGESNNGIEAIKKAVTHEPDLILMDIFMPLKDGIEASYEIKKILPQSQIIILTAFDSFDYAQQAIKIGVKDFLVKPYSDQEFYSTLAKTIRAIKHNRKHNQEIISLKKQMENYYEVLEKEILLNVIHNDKLLPKNMQHLLQQRKISYPQFECILIKVRNLNFILQKKDLVKVKSLINSSHLKIGIIYINTIILIITKLKQKDYEFLITNINKYFNHYYDEKVIIIKSPDTNNINEIPKLYVKSMNYLQDKLSKEIKDNNKNMILNKCIDEINKNIISEKKEFALNSFNNFFVVIIEKESKNINSIRVRLMKLYIIIYQELVNTFGENLNIRTVKQVYNDVMEIKSLMDLKNYIRNLLIETINTISIFKENRNVKTIKKIKKYIDQNYSKDISLNDIADRYNISYFHLSKTFKQIYGKNFKDYLLDVRMDHAKKLLRKSNSNISTIAQKVGYIDPNYFSKVFKKYTGLSPSSYLNL